MEEVALKLTTYVSSFLFYTGGVTFTFGLSAAGLFWVFNKMRWTRVTESGPKWFNGLSLFGAILSGLIIGAVVGIEVGGLRTGLKVASDVGSLLIDQGMVLVTEELGVSDQYESMDVSFVRLALNEIQDFSFEHRTGFEGRLANASLGAVRGPFGSEAEHVIARFAPGDEGSMSWLVPFVWDRIFSELNAEVASVIRTRIWAGYAWLAGFSAAAMIATWVIRGSSKNDGV